MANSCPILGAYLQQQQKCQTQKRKKIVQSWALIFTPKKLPNSEYLKTTIYSSEAKSCSIHGSGLLQTVGSVATEAACHSLCGVSKHIIFCHIFECCNWIRTIVNWKWIVIVNMAVILSNLTLTRYIKSGTLFASS